MKAKNHQYRIRLKATDREFVEEFDRAVSAVLRCPPHRIWKTAESEFYVEVGSYLFHKFLLRPLGELKPFIEHCRKCVSAFIRGFFDSEGCVAPSGVLTASNTDLRLLEYVRNLLLDRFAIETTGPNLGTRKGSILIRRGRSYRRNSDCYTIRVRNRSLKQFNRIIGLTIGRKSLRLAKKLRVVKA